MNLVKAPSPKKRGAVLGRLQDRPKHHPDLEDTAGAADRVPVSASLTKHVGNYRWTICGLLFFATTLNYMDRQVLALLLPTLQDPIRGIGLTQVSTE